ncbi:MAG: hypothetical protein QF902_06205 [Rhodospirillales bacterium]|nr:hypothetical protein [Rhodospirillales bacterium]
MATRFLVLAVVVVLAACGAVPKPFHTPADAPANVLAAPGASVDVRVEAIEGTPQPLARLLARSVAEELAALHLTAVAREKGSSRYTLSGQARTAAGDGSETHAVVIEWSLRDSGGDIVVIHSQGVEATREQWDFGDPRAVRRTGRDAAAAIVRLLAEEAAPEAIVEGPVRRILVVPVRGAPGDGNDSLTAAVKQALRRRTLFVTDDVAFANYWLEGAVAVGPAREGRQPVQVVWIVSHADGSEIGTVRQGNTVVAGSLDGPWGSLADVIGTAAVEGIENAVNAVIRAP